MNALPGISERRKFEELLHWVTGSASVAINSYELIVEEKWGTHEVASTEQVKKLTSGKMIGNNDLEGTKDLVWKIEKVLAHTRLIGDLLYMSLPLQLYEIVENWLPYVFQQAWNKKAYKLNILLGCKVDVCDFLRYLHKHIELLSSVFGPSTFKSFKNPKETPGSVGSYILQKSGTRHGY